MSQKPDGGPAFPQHFQRTELHNCHTGLSLRDYFAAHSMPLAFDSTLSINATIAQLTERPSVESAAAAAYLFADAMIAARSLNSSADPFSPKDETQ